MGRREGILMLRIVVLLLALVTCINSLAQSGTTPEPGIEKEPGIETLKLSELGNQNYPIIVDVTKVSKVHIPYNKMGTVNIRVVNIAPAHREKYSFEISSQIIGVKPFVRPEQQDPFVQEDGNDKAKQQGCNSLISATEQLSKEDIGSDKISVLVDKIGKLLKEVDSNVCETAINAAKNYVAQTQLNIEAKVEYGSELTVTILADRKNISEIKLINKPVEWMNHVGFTFAWDRNDNYFSKENGGTYSIAKQNNNSDIVYSATVLFTYPILGDRQYGFGWSTGMGLAQDSIQLSTGPSFILGENFIFNFGIMVMQFERLKGIYKKGDNIGAQPLDSSAFTDKEYDLTFSTTLGYRFK